MRHILLPLTILTQRTEQNSEAAAGVVVKILQISKENTCAGSLFNKVARR